MATRKCKKNDKVIFRDDSWTVTDVPMRDEAYRTYYELRNDEDVTEREMVRTDRFVKLR